MDEVTYKSYIGILKEELLPAMGCTEPISVAYAAALARKTLGSLPKRVEISVSGNILKNVKSVIVPNTGGLKGIAAAAAAGIVAGKAEGKLQVLEGITESEQIKISEYLKSHSFKVDHSQSGCVFDIGVRVYSGDDSAFVRIEGHHTNVVAVEKNGEKLLCVDGKCVTEHKLIDRTILNVKDIIEFANTAEIGDIEELISRQIEYNCAIAENGLKNDYGARVGKILLSSFGDSVNNRAKATAAAGSDARMNGCSLPVVIVSGSGNQGMTASLPVVVYAKHLGVSREKLLRAVTLSDLITIHLKTGIGRLSAYCGAVSAGAGAGAGISYLYGGGLEEISQTITNALAITSGLICDGAKSSCAAKIASAVDAGLIGMEMSRKGCCFQGGDGILECGVENTIDNVCDLARIGMRETDEEIIRLMIKNLG
ncbi:MAG: L-serine ammonia-lyase, iron-sulfur-dependent, subunit alpha [Firmicutes bacterium]|nr:L-serine ammonia-lyase, iron-sulfur-dependent, subunit alpha [Bacillota bacterium]MCM1393607.1 L-serine ammonia-lyase, iron-sulfur-dependent, subunit alpha [[Eubacterium] siraeum]